MNERMAASVVDRLLTTDHPYAGRRAVLATQHAKGRAVAVPLMRRLGLGVDEIGIDTDRFGTFSGEVPRLLPALDTAIAKARAGMQAARRPIGLASEGSFGPHPTLPVLPGGQEVLVFVDDERGIVIHESLVTDETNYAQLVVKPGEPIAGFLLRAGFPDHGLVVKPNVDDDPTPVARAVDDPETLLIAIAEAARQSRDLQARLETDMRAHVNPTRMRSIRKLARRLAVRLATLCPSCGAPGFGRVGIERGLPCDSCGAPTGFVKAERWQCVACDHAEMRARPDGLKAIGAEHCPVCNP
jgi:hypothetical protein